MSKIFKLSANTRVSELNGTVGNVLKSFSDMSPMEDANLQDIMDELKVKNNQLSVAMEQTRQLSAMENYDGERDHAYRSAFNYLRGCTFLPSGLSGDAARALFPTFQKYGMGIVSLAYDEQTGQLNSLFEELKSEANQKHIAAISSMDTLLEILTTAQAEFVQAYSDYATKVGSLKAQQTATEIKWELLAILNEKLVMYMRAMSKIGSNKYQAFAQELSLFINKTNQNVKERINSEKKSRE